MLYIFFAYILISNIRYLFIDDSDYLLHLFKDFFYAFGMLIIWVIEDMFRTDCIIYDKTQFTINRGSLRPSQDTNNYNYNDIVKINYMPYLRLLTIKMKEENTYIDIATDNYSFAEFEPFLQILESYQPISRGFYIPDDGITTRTGKIIATVVVIFFSMLIMLGVYANNF